MALPHGHTLSLELFAPRSAGGVDDLLADCGRLASYSALGPAFVSVSGPVDSTLRILDHLRKTHCIRPQLQVVRSDVTEDNVLALLAEAGQLGICDLLVLGGPPNVPPPAAGSGRFASTTELVSFVKQRLGERVRVAVCGYPRGSRGERAEYGADLAELGRQVAAGAERVICLPCFDAETHWSFVADARAAGVYCPIAPGILPITNIAEFRRICHALLVEPPKWLDAKLRGATSTACVPSRPCPPALANRLSLSCSLLPAILTPRTQYAYRRGLAAVSEAVLIEHLTALSSTTACTPHIYTLNSDTVLRALATAGYRPLKHRI